jgi:hypothetical protein
MKKSASLLTAEARVNGQIVPLALPSGARACWFTVRLRHGRRTLKVWLAVHLRRDGTPDIVVQLPKDLKGLRVHVHQGGACLHCVEPSEQKQRR